MGYDAATRTALAGLDTAMMPKSAMILAAGLGTRMRPYNGQIPKPLVAVGGKSLIDYGLDRLAEAGVETAVVNVHHLADALEKHRLRPIPLSFPRRPPAAPSTHRLRRLSPRHSAKR